MNLHDDFRPSRKELAEIAAIGLPAAWSNLWCELVLWSFPKRLLPLEQVNSLHIRSVEYSILTMMNGQVFSISSTSLTGQSLGKKRPDMAQAYTTRCKRCGMAIAITLGILFVIFGRPLLVCTRTTQPVLHYVSRFSGIVAFIQPFHLHSLSWQVHSVVPVIQSFVAKLTCFTVMLLRPGLALLAINVFSLGLPGPGLLSWPIRSSVLPWLHGAISLAGGRNPCCVQKLLPDTGRNPVVYASTLEISNIFLL